MTQVKMKFPSSSHFLVTGGAGFIGSNLCEKILELGYRVRCLDDLSTGFYANMQSFLHHPDFEFVEGDIKDFDTCLKATQDIDFVLHQAAWGSVPRSITLPQFYTENNITGTLNMLEASKVNRIKKFVYASSSSVYGDEKQLPKKEGCEGRLLSPYALTKRCNEEWAKQYTYHYGLDTYGLRYFNVFGRRQNSDGDYAAVIPRFIKTLIDNKAPTIYGDGMQSRDFTFVTDVVQANLRACLAEPEASGKAYNIAYGGNERLIDIYHTLTTALGKSIEPIFGPERKGDVKHSQADIQMARVLLGYEPQYTFKSGLEESIQWYVENLKVQPIDLKG